MKVLDLFSGIGGFSLGLERAGFETVAFCEFEPHAQAILKKHWPDVPIFDDVRELDGRQFRGSVDIVCGGFPCQDLSVAGKKAGFDGDRSSLYVEMLRIISECLPRYAIFENVTGLLSGDNGRWFAQFLYDLAEVGYDAEWHCIEAAYLGAPHRRDRVWIIAYPSEGGRDDGEHHREKRHIQGESERNHTEDKPERSGRFARAWALGEVLSNALRDRQQRSREFDESEYSKAVEDWEAGRSISGCIGEIWETEPRVGRVVDGVWKKSYQDRLERLGNSVVPQIPEAIGLAIANFEANK
jgi:DNA (cytosine-5)-methyltransferase 1